MPQLLSPGQRLGSYEIISQIAQGGMGIVYRARQTSLQRDVALKVLFPHLTDDPEFVARFQREAQSSAQLRHPNIVQVFDAHEVDGLHFIAMEYVGGGTLAQELASLRKSGQFMPVEKALHVARDVALALDFAHTKGLVHRDIKPSNVLRGEDGRYVLSDFGIVLDAQKTKLTRNVASMGTPEYMSPEQAQGLGVDRRSDVYSLGIVLYEMLTGLPPFQSENPLSVLNKHVNETPPSIPRLRVDVPATVQSVVLRALAKKPQDRFQTAAQMVAAIDTGLGAFAAPAEKKPARWLAPVLALVALVAFAGAAILLISSGTAAPPPSAPAATAATAAATTGVAVIATSPPTPAPTATPQPAASATAEPPATQRPQPTSTLAPASSGDAAAPTPVVATVVVVVTATPAPTATPGPTATRGPTRTPAPTPTPTASPTPAGLTGMTISVLQNRGGYERWGKPNPQNPCIGEDKRGVAQKFTVGLSFANKSGSDIRGLRAAFVAQNGLTLNACGQIPTIPNNNTPNVSLYVLTEVPISAVVVNGSDGKQVFRKCFTGINAVDCTGPLPSLGGAIAPPAVVAAPPSNATPTPVAAGTVDFRIFNNSGTTNLDVFVFDNGEYRPVWRLNNAETKTVSRPSGRVSLRICRQNSSGECFLIERVFAPGAVSIQINGYDIKGNCTYEYRNDTMRTCIGVSP